MFIWIIFSLQFYFSISGIISNPRTILPFIKSLSNGLINFSYLAID